MRTMYIDFESTEEQEGLMDVDKFRVIGWGLRTVVARMLF